MNRLAADLAMASSLTEPFRQGLSAMLDEPSKLAGQFDSSMRNIQSLTNESNESLADLGKQLLDVGSGAVAGPNAIADAFYNITSGIGKAEVRMDTLRAAIALAESGQTDLAAATSGLITVVNAYNTPAEHMTDLSDVFFQTVRKGVGSLGGFVGAISQISGIAANVGIGFDELGANMAYLTTGFVKTEAEGATQIKAAITSLLKPNKDLSEALARVGIESGSTLLAEHGLADALNIVKSAVGGSQDAMASALGSTEALNAAIAFTSDGYTAFAQSYSEGLSGATSDALRAQAQSYEARVAKLQAAADALKIQTGDDINAIKGFFVDMGAGFLTNVVGPIMSSPVGGVFQGIAAGAGLAANSILSLGSGALNVSSQLVVLTATLQNSGGFTKLFGNAFGGLLSPVKQIGSSIAGMIGPLVAKTTATFAATAAEVGFAGAMWATAGAVWAATWPILAIVAGVAALAFGGYMLVKHWDAVSAFFINLWNTVTGAFSAAFDWIKNLLGGVSNKVLGAIAVFLPIIGIPALIIKNWDTIQAFFAGLWVRITNLFTSAGGGIKNFFTGLWAGIVGGFTSAWNGILSFFTSVWNWILQIVASAAAWFAGVWVSVTSGFASAWTWVSDLFTSIWEGIKGVVMGFVEWLSPVVDAIIAPFRAIGDTIGGIIGSIKGWFGETVEMGKIEIAGRRENKTQDSVAKPVDTIPAEPVAQGAEPLIPSTIPPAPSFAVTPVPDVTAAVTATGTNTGTSGGGGLLEEHQAAAGRKGIAVSEMTTTASDAFMSAGITVPPAAVTPIMDMGELNRQAASNPFLDSLSASGAETVTSGMDTIADFDREVPAAFQEAMPKQSAAFAPWPQPETKTAKSEPSTINVQNLYLQADDCFEVFDIVRQIKQAVFSPEEAVV
jgi:TP901 family phage tail tape measure protein